MGGREVGAPTLWSPIVVKWSHSAMVRKLWNLRKWYHSRVQLAASVAVRRGGGSDRYPTTLIPRTYTKARGVQLMVSILRQRVRQRV